MADLQYLLVYPEGYPLGDSVSWTTRQIAVFHRYSPSGSGNICILLHAKPRSTMQMRLEVFCFPLKNNINLQRDWHILHFLVLSCHIGNWRWYMRSLGRAVEGIIGTTSSMRILNVMGREQLTGFTPD